MPLGQHWLIAIMLCVSGIGFVIAMGSSTIAQISTENWEEGTGIVEDFEIICYEQEDSSCSWEENIIYTYDVNGQSYTNTEISLAWRVPEYVADTPVPPLRPRVSLDRVIDIDPDPSDTANDPDPET